MTMPSDGRRKPASIASAAEPVGRADRIAAKARVTARAGSGSTSWQRSRSCVQPPQPGTSPTPGSGRPIASSAWATIASAWSANSAPPPSAKPCAAATTGTGASRIRRKRRWPRSS